MLRGRDARAADGGRGMAWVGGHRGRARRCKGTTGKRGWRETGSRGAPWVMLRDETPRGVIEQRRREKERRGGSRRAGLKEWERVGGWERGRVQPGRRGAEACPALILKSTLVGLAPPRQPSAFSFLSFSTFQTCGNRRCSATKIQQPTGSYVMGMKNALPTSPFSRSSSVPISLWRAWRLFACSFKHRRSRSRIMIPSDSRGIFVL